MSSNITPPVRSRFLSQRQRRAHLLAHPPRRLQRSGCLRVVQLAGRVEIPEDDGIFGQTGGFLEQRGERGIHRDALRSQFLQVVSLAEGDVMKREESFGGLFGRLLAVEYGVGRLFPSINVPSSDPYQPGPASGGPRHAATRLASYSRSEERRVGKEGRSR